MCYHIPCQIIVYIINADKETRNEPPTPFEAPGYILLTYVHAVAVSCTSLAYQLLLAIGRLTAA